MKDYLTTRELQDLLQVDRTTIYRMADAGRVPAVKVGNQWRFPRQKVDTWLQNGQNGAWRQDAKRDSADEGAKRSVIDLRKLLPLECVQLIQDTFADALGVMILVTDLDGEPVTRPSNPCGLFTAADSSPVARKRCMQLWADLARRPSLQPQFIRSHLGLLCARGLISTGAELKAMLVVGGVAPRDWPPSEQEIEQIAEDLEMPADLIREHVHDVFDVGPDEQRKLLGIVQQIADIVAHIMSERNALLSKLSDIAELTKV